MRRFSTKKGGKEPQLQGSVLSLSRSQNEAQESERLVLRGSRSPDPAVELTVGVRWTFEALDQNIEEPPRGVFDRRPVVRKYVERDPPAEAFRSFGRASVVRRPCPKGTAPPGALALPASAGGLEPTGPRSAM